MLISVVIISVLSLCSFNNVAAAPVTKLTPDTYSNYGGDLRGRQQTYILATINEDRTTVTMEVGQNASLDGVLSYGTPPTSWLDTSHGIQNATINIQSMNPDGKTWSTVATKSTIDADPDNPFPMSTVRMFAATLTPEATGVYTYR